MFVKLRRMTNEEFESFYGWSIEHQAKELMEELHISQEEAISETIKEVAEILPDGVDTPHNYFMTIVDSDSDENIGFVWTLHEVTGDRKQSFICDLAIWGSNRRKGYASAALCLLENQAAEAGCAESVLFVKDDNAAAKALYKKCGYQVLRQHGYGKYMIKQL